MSIYFYGCITIDGYLADSNHSLSWLHETGTTEDTGYDEFYNKMDIAIMGRKTFDEISKLDNPGLFYPSTTNYVFINDKDFNYEGFHAVKGDIVDFVKGLGNKNIWIVGGGQILAPLLDAELVDTLIIQIAPLVLGEGISLFSQKEMVQRFNLEKVNKYGQFAELVYIKK